MEARRGGAPPPGSGRELAGVSLARLTTIQAGGAAKEFFAPQSAGELEALLARFSREARSPFLLGKGANTLFPDGEFQRPVICTRRLRALTVEGETLRAEAGVPLSHLISAAIRQGLGGLEGFVGIPATVGGAVMMNAGGGGWSFGERVARLGVIPLAGGHVLELDGREVAWGYRSAKLDGFVVAWAEVRLVPDSIPRLAGRARTFLQRKASTQPLSEPSAGCIFRNPPGLSAGRLIDELGLKGSRRGEARVSDLHGNFIVNPLRLATAKDILELVEEVRARVEEARGVKLETEIVLA